MDLRTLIRHGKKVLQYEDCGRWIDIPEVVECEEHYHVTIKGEKDKIQPVMDEIQTFVIGLKRQHEGVLEIGACCGNCQSEHDDDGDDNDQYPNITRTAAKKPIPSRLSGNQ